VNKRTKKLYSLDAYSPNFVRQILQLCGLLIFENVCANFKKLNYIGKHHQSKLSHYFKTLLSFS